MKPIELVCLIDDDTMFTYILSKQIKIANFCNNLLIFHSATDALKYLQPILENPESLPDVILLDINMPVMDGWDFLDEFVKFNTSKKITVYIVSSSVNIADRERAEKYTDVSHFYIKPLAKDDFIKMLSQTKQENL